jgi:hypothetical protein
MKFIENISEEKLEVYKFSTLILTFLIITFTFHQ